MAALLYISFRKYCGKDVHRGPEEIAQWLKMCTIYGKDLNSTPRTQLQEKSTNRIERQFTCQKEVSSHAFGKESIFGTQRVPPTQCGKISNGKRQKTYGTFLQRGQISGQKEHKKQSNIINNWTDGNRSCLMLPTASRKDISKQPNKHKKHKKCKWWFRGGGTLLFIVMNKK